MQRATIAYMYAYAASQPLSLYALTVEEKKKIMSMHAMKQIFGQETG